MKVENYMSMSIEEYIAGIYRLRYITRYANRIRVRDEDVAQHSFFVSAIILKLHDDYKFDLGLALQLAVSHDITEADLSDVAHDVKQKHPKLAEEIKNAEIKELAKYPAAVIKGSVLFNACSTVEGLIANLADVIQVRQYVLSELSIGNSTLSDIDIDSRSRMASLRKELKPHVKLKKDS